MVEQRYRAVLEVLSGIPVTEVAERYGVARRTVHRKMARYRVGGVGGLATRSRASKDHPRRIAADVEAVICDLRWSHAAGVRGGWCLSWTAGAIGRCRGTLARRQKRRDHQPGAACR